MFEKLFGKKEEKRFDAIVVCKPFPGEGLEGLSLSLIEAEMVLRYGSDSEWRYSETETYVGKATTTSCGNFRIRFHNITEKMLNTIIKNANWVIAAEIVA